MVSRHVDGSERSDVAVCELRAPAAVLPFAAVALGAVVSGGLVAAASRPLDWERGPWLAAFLVLVVGVGQAGLAVGQWAASRGAIPASVIATELALANAGAACVVLGTLLTSPVTTTAGSLAFATAVAVFARHSTGDGWHRPWVRRSYVGLVALLGASIPVGIALSWIRA